MKKVTQVPMRNGVPFANSQEPPQGRLSKAISAITQERVKGLGDAVAVVAKPVARAIGMKNCEGCDERQNKLNKL